MHTVYAEHFGLKDNPFSPASQPPAPFPSQELKEALAHFVYAQENREGFFLLVGEVGTGKSTAIQAILETIGSEVPVAVLRHSTLKPHELLEEILRRYGLQVREGESKPALIARLEEYLVPRSLEAAAVLILDEAHLLSHASLEELRLLSNMKHGDRPLLQICLVGQPELITRLRQHRLRPLRQRIAVRYIVGTLTQAETREYLAHRLRAAGSRGAHQVFSPEAAEAVHDLAAGLPREINVVASQAMLNAYLESSEVVTPEHVMATRRDYGFEGLRLDDRTVEATMARAHPRRAAPAEAPPPPDAPAPSAQRATDLPLQSADPARARPRPRRESAERSLLVVDDSAETHHHRAVLVGIALAALIALALILYAKPTLLADWTLYPPPDGAEDLPPISAAHSPPPAAPEVDSTSVPSPPVKQSPPVESASPLRQEPVPDQPAPPPVRTTSPPAPAAPAIPIASPSPSPLASAADRLEHGVSLARNGRLDEATAAFREAIQEEPDYVDAHYNLGVSLLDSGEPAAAADALAAAVKLAPRDAIAQRTYGIALREAGRLDEAAAALRESVALGPEDAFAHQHLGSVLRELGEIEGAVEATGRAIGLKPDDPSLHQQLGFALRQGGHLEQAAGAFRRALELDPNLAVARYSLGVTLHELGRKSEAQREIAEAKRLGYSPH